MLLALEAPPRLIRKRCQEPFFALNLRGWRGIEVHDSGDTTWREMMRSRIRITAALILGLAGLVMWVTAGASVIEESFDAEGLTKLVVESDAGSVRVKAGNSNQIRVQVERSGWAADHFDVEFSRESPALIVRGEYDDNEDRYENGHVKFTIEVPKSFDVDISTRGGSITIDDIDGEARVDTAGGSIKLGQIGGTVDASTAGGSISLSGSNASARLSTAGGSIKIGDVKGNVSANTAGGSINIERAAGTVEARTAGGSINVRDSVGAVNASTAGGSISAYFSQQPSESSSLRTSGGGVTVYLAENVGVNIDAHSDRGNIWSDFELDNAQISKRNLSGKLNGGGPNLNIDANGSVRIERK